METTRIEALQTWLVQNKIDFAYLSHPTNVFYLTGFRCQPHERFLGVFLFPEHEPFLVCPAMEVPQAKASSESIEIAGYHDHENPWDKVAALFQKRAIAHPQNAAIESEFLPYSKANALQQSFSGPLTFVSVERIIQSLRAIKTEKEIKILRQAAEMADRAVQIGCEAIDEGETEMAIVAKIEYECAKLGFSEMAFTTMVLTGKNSALPHGNPGNNRIKPGDFVLFDLGLVIDGYCSDITRTVAYKHVSEAQKRIYDTVLKAESEAIAACSIGKRLGDLDQVARRIIETNGYGDYFPHRLGHGLGLEAHEAPSISHDNNQPIEKGMVFTIEPGVYVPEIGGVRIEDDVYIGESGVEVLTKFPKELLII